jgi:hypothetical protein
MQICIKSEIQSTEKTCIKQKVSRKYGKTINFTGSIQIAEKCFKLSTVGVSAICK